MGPDARAEYPLLADRLDDLEEIVLEPFEKHDAAALRIQRQHRRFQMLLIVGVALTAVFGALQAALDEARWVGVVLAVLALAAAGVSNQQRRSKPLTRYLIERAKAEELRSLYFGYLSGRGDIDSRQLEAAVVAISYRAETPKETER